jgi:hypothetical protein
LPVNSTTKDGSAVNVERKTGMNMALLTATDSGTSRLDTPSVNRKVEPEKSTVTDSEKLAAVSSSGNSLRPVNNWGYAICPHCKTEFKKRSHNNQYCSADCQREFKKT